MPDLSENSDIEEIRKAIVKDGVDPEKDAVTFECVSNILFK